jgi:hypothetical protein
MARKVHQPPKLYFNEHLSPELAAALRQRGFDVIASLEVGMANGVTRNIWNTPSVKSEPC